VNKLNREELFGVETLSVAELSLRAELALGLVGQLNGEQPFDQEIHLDEEPASMAALPWLRVGQ
jgi:hypothetical protein